jgi:hypothetical protein
LNSSGTQVKASKPLNMGDVRRVVIKTAATRGILNRLTARSLTIHRARFGSNVQSLPFSCRRSPKTGRIQDFIGFIGISGPRTNRQMAGGVARARGHAWPADNTNATLKSRVLFVAWYSKICRRVKSVPWSLRQVVIGERNSRPFKATCNI